MTAAGVEVDAVVLLLPSRVRDFVELLDLLVEDLDPREPIRRIDLAASQEHQRVFFTVRAVSADLCPCRDSIAS